MPRAENAPSQPEHDMVLSGHVYRRVDEVMRASLVYSIDEIAYTLRTANASLIATGPSLMKVAAETA